MSEQNDQMVRRNLFIADKQYFAMQRLARHAGVTVAELYRTAAQEYLVRKVEQLRSERAGGKR